MPDLAQPPTRIRVSSTLNRDTKQFGKKFLTDGTEETCWNSDQGSPQFIDLDFTRPVNPAALRLMFQGGFAGKECELVGTRMEPGDQGEAGERCTFSLGEFWPADSNTVQEFPIACPQPITQMRIVFKSTTDFFGRVTIYSLEISGDE
eukprot:m.72536 g.72536  ORF g.72536 m.72536 type:complete len:148 (+) comp8789_c0_seq2:113-556(+)